MLQVTAAVRQLRDHGTENTVAMSLRPLLTDENSSLTIFPYSVRVVRLPVYDQSSRDYLQMWLAYPSMGSAFDNVPNCTYNITMS